MSEQDPTGSPAARAADYETLLAGLRNRIDAQVELLQSLAAAGEMAMKNKGIGLDALIDPLALTVKEDYARERAKFDAQMAFYDEVVRKRDSEI